MLNERRPLRLRRRYPGRLAMRFGLIAHVAGGRPVSWMMRYRSTLHTTGLYDTPPNEFQIFAISTVLRHAAAA